MIELDWPWVLLMLPLPWLAYRFLKPATADEAALHAPFYQQLVSLSAGSASSSLSASARPKLWRVLLLLAWCSLVLAASKPQWVGEAVQLPASGRDLMLAVDLSGSMQQIDLQLNGVSVTRLAVVKQVLKEFIERRTGDRIGLILFGSQAYLQAPLTFDRQTVGTLLEEAQFGFAGEKTAIGDAIGLAVKRLRSRSVSPSSTVSPIAASPIAASTQQTHVLILLTDGANTAGEISPLKAAELAQQENIKIHTIGVGASEMIEPGFFGARRINPSADLDETTLKQIASQTGGQYFRAHNTQQLEQIYALLDQLEPTELEQQSFNPVRSLYVWPLASALLLSLLLFVLKTGIPRAGFLSAHGSHSKAQQETSNDR